MKSLTCTLFFSLALHSFAVRNAPVEKPAETPAPATKVAAGEPVQIELKNKSSFMMDENGRNPFWPLGWRPASKATAATGAEHGAPEIAPTAFMVSSITVDSSGRFAIVNGKVMSEGQVFGLQLGNQTYQLTVKSIQDGQVILQRRDQEIVVPLHRR